MKTITMKSLSTIILSLLFAVSVSQPVMAKTAVSKQIVAQTTTVNLNTADAKQIANTLKGIGMKKAKAIIAYRKQHGDFKAIEELASVKGIGVATIAKNHSRIALK